MPDGARDDWTTWMLLLDEKYELLIGAGENE
jgi:hypothetical protein